MTVKAGCPLRNAVADPIERRPTTGIVQQKAQLAPAKPMIERAIFFT